MALGRGHHDQSSSAPNRQTASLIPRIIETILPFRYTDNARYFDTLETSALGST